MYFICYLFIKYICMFISIFIINFILLSTPFPSARPTKVEIKYLCNAWLWQRQSQCQWQRLLAERFVAELWGLQRQYP